MTIRLPSCLGGFAAKLDCPRTQARLIGHDREPLVLKRRPLVRLGGMAMRQLRVSLRSLDPLTAFDFVHRPLSPSEIPEVEGAQTSLSPSGCASDDGAEVLFGCPLSSEDQLLDGRAVNPDGLHPCLSNFDLVQAMILLRDDRSGRHS